VSRETKARRDPLGRIAVDERIVEVEIGIEQRRREKGQVQKTEAEQDQAPRIAAERPS
jgi:hypothetical protein